MRCVVYLYNTRYVQLKKDAIGDEGKAAIVTWQYILWLQVDTEKYQDKNFWYCTRISKGYGYYIGLNVWWDVCELTALMLLSSGTSACVFSLGSMLLRDQQNRLLYDYIKSSLSCIE